MNQSQKRLCLYSGRAEKSVRFFGILLNSRRSMRMGCIQYAIEKLGGRQNGL